MKTAKEWAKDYWNRSQENKKFMAFIREVQLDAWKQGMTDAAQEGKFIIGESETIYCFEQRILTARDNKTSL